MNITLEQAKKAAEAISASLTFKELHSNQPEPNENHLNSAGDKASIANFLASRFGEAGQKIVGRATSPLLIASSLYKINNGTATLENYADILSVLGVAISSTMLQTFAASFSVGYKGGKVINDAWGDAIDNHVGNFSMEVGDYFTKITGVPEVGAIMSGVTRSLGTIELGFEKGLDVVGIHAMVDKAVRWSTDPDYLKDANNAQVSSLLNNEREMKRLYQEGLISKAFYNDFTKWSADALRKSADNLLNTLPPNFGSSGVPVRFPTGAFYDSSTLASDSAQSIADKTLVLVDNRQRGASAGQFSALDFDKDGQLSGKELDALSAWADLNENGQVEADEVRSVRQRGTERLSASVFAFFTQARSLFDRLTHTTLEPGAAPILDRTSLAPTAKNQVVAKASDSYVVGTAADDHITGNAGNNRMFGGKGHDYLFGGDGRDVLQGEEGDDVLLGEAGDDELWGDDGRDTLLGGGGADQLVGGRGNDLLMGEADKDRLFGEAGDDILYGGDGDDTLIGFTASNASQQALLPGETDNDTLYGGAGRDNLGGGPGDDLLFGEAGDDRLFGQVGDDVLYGGDGDDTLFGFMATNDRKQTLEPHETDNDWLYGGTGNDKLLGGIGHDYLDGGAGADYMEGGQGDDTYVANSVNDSILELRDAGYDRVISSTSYLLNAHIEELRLLEGFDIHGTGNALDNVLIGNSRDNILDGVTGADRMLGGAGNDTYYVDNADDQTIELANEGLDTVQASISHTLADNLENLTLLDFAKAEKGLVDGKPSLIYGYPKANELDYMQGDANPNYQGTCGMASIANLLTQVGRPSSEGELLQMALDEQWIDRSYYPSQEGGTTVEQQQAMLDSHGIRNDTISGYNEAGTANLLRSGRGVVQAVNAGVLWNSPRYMASGSVNHLVTITGVAYGEATGELLGFYIADSGRKLVSDMTRFVGIELFRQAANVAGAYTIYTIEPLKLWGENINATGNSQDNLLVGNRGDNVLTGGAGNDSLEGQGGNDVLDGGAGDDTLIGGAGNDTYLFGRGYGHDTVKADALAASEAEYVRFLEAVGPDNLWFSRNGRHLDVSIIGTQDRLTVNDWFTDPSKQNLTFETNEGEALVASQLNRLIDAMAAFSPPSSGTSLSQPNYKEALEAVIATGWS